MLPNLLNNISLQNSIRDISQLGKQGNSINESLLSIGKPGQNQSMEIMMLKRLNFLRNSLESHNPRETTMHLRE
jgi:hypothetical protein